MYIYIFFVFFHFCIFTNCLVAYQPTSNFVHFYTFCIFAFLYLYEFTLINLWHTNLPVTFCTFIFLFEYSFCIFVFLQNTNFLVAYQPTSNVLYFFCLLYLLYFFIFLIYTNYLVAYQPTSNFLYFYMFWYFCFYKNLYKLPIQTSVVKLTISF